MDLHYHPLYRLDFRFLSIREFFFSNLEEESSGRLAMNGIQIYTQRAPGIETKKKRVDEN